MLGGISEGVGVAFNKRGESLGAGSTLNMIVACYIDGKALCSIVGN